MVLSVLLCAGAVPLTDDHHQVYQPLPSSNIVVASQVLRESSQSSSQQQQPQSPEYVQYLEHLVDELSCVFANWVQQNPPSSPSSPPTSPSPARLVDMYQQRVTCQRSNSTSSAPHPSSSGLSQLPDLIAHHNNKTSSSSGKQQCSTSTTTSTPMSSRRGDDLRIRRGLAPMRFRLDSVGSTCSVASSTVSSPTSVSFAESPTSPSYMAFDLLGGDYSSSTPSSASSTTSFFSDVDDFVDNSHLVSTPLSATDFEPSDSLTTDSTDAAVDPAADWRRIGRDLRGIADHFASTRSQNTTGCQQQSQWTLVSSLLGSPLASAGPIVSALAVYLWWKLVRRIAP